MRKMTVTVLAFWKKDQNTQMVKTNKRNPFIIILWPYKTMQIHGVDLVWVLILFQNTSYDDEFLGMNACPAISPFTNGKRLQNNNR